MSAKDERDKALRRVKRRSGPWWDIARSWVDNHLYNWTGTAEDMRLLMTPYVGKPHHHNVWGSLSRELARDGILIHTNARTNMKTDKSHARDTPIYKSRTRTLPPQIGTFFSRPQGAYRK